MVLIKNQVLIARYTEVADELNWLRLDKGCCRTQLIEVAIKLIEFWFEPVFGLVLISNRGSSTAKPGGSNEPPSLAQKYIYYIIFVYSLK